MFFGCTVGFVSLLILKVGEDLFSALVASAATNRCGPEITGAACPNLSRVLDRM